MNRFTGLKTLFIIGAKFHEEKRDIKKSRQSGMKLLWKSKTQ